MKLFFQVLPKTWPWFFALTLACTLLEQLLSKGMSKVMTSDHPSIVLMAYFGSMSFLLSLVGPALGSLIVFHRIFVTNFENYKNMGFNQFLSHTVKPLTIESLRALGQTILYSFFFIIPGVIRYVQLIFVPLIVIFDPNYEKGEVEALKRSRQLVSKKIFWVLLLLFVGYLVYPLASSSLFTESKELTETPILATLFVAIDALVEIFINCVLFSLYKSAEIQ